LLDALIGPVAYRQAIAEARGKSLSDYHTVRVPVSLTEQEQQRYDMLSLQIRSFVCTRRDQHPRYRWEDVCRESASDPEARAVLKAFHAKAAIETRATEKLRVLEDLFRLHAQEQVLVFTGANQMAVDVSRRFLIPVIIDKTRLDERRWILDGFQSGRLRAMVANQVLDEGIDVPAVKVAVVLGGFSSPRQATQRLGRILRRSGRATAVLYEVVCEETRETLRSQRRRRGDAYGGAKRLRL
jgi:superfamily II DNA or RNA helicase